MEEDITKIMKKVNDLTGEPSYQLFHCLMAIGVLHIGVKESDTGIAVPASWDLAADKQALHQEEPLQVCLYVVMVINCVHTQDNSVVFIIRIGQLPVCCIRGDSR